ncbi:hypothetical protein K8Z49_24310 [Actinomadura madurae]|uniref:hypothetical protein n=1 Tax=Actinomadura madurae TaxID=1993 RepID=UPI00399BBA33
MGIASCRVGASGLDFDDGGGNRWTLTWVDDERAVLVGADHEFSRTAWHDPPIDFLADAPDWFPHAWFREVDDGALGFVFWWDGGGWDRSPYPETAGDDGSAIAKKFSSDDSVHDLFSDGDWDDEALDALDDLIAAAEECSVDEAVLSRVFERFGARRYDLAAALACAEEAGLTPDSRRVRVLPYETREVRRFLPADAPPPEFPDLGEALASAADDPPEARRRVVGSAVDLPAWLVPAFFEHACRTFHVAGHGALASAFLRKAWEAEDSFAALFGLAPDTARSHRTVLELVPAGAFAPDLVREYLARLSARPDAAAAHAEAREVADAVFALGAVPDPGLITDLVAGADAAGTEGTAEEDWVAERLLRHDLLRRSARPVWEAVRSAMRRVCYDSADLRDLLIAADPGRGDALEQVRLEWLRLLAWSRAGAHLSPEWFVSLGPAPAEPLASLVDQATDRLFAPSAGGGPVRSAEPLAFRNLDKNRPEGGPAWVRRDDLDEPARRLRDDPAGFRDELDWFVRTVTYYASNATYLGRFCEVRELGEALAGRVREWTAQVSAGDLLGLEIALPHLVPLADAGHTGIDPDAFAGLAISDPVDVVYRALRTGLPEELAPPVAPRPGKARVVATQHLDLLTVAIGSSVEVHGPDGVVHRAKVASAAGRPWYDGESFYVSSGDVSTGTRRTLRVVNAEELAYDPEARDRWPNAPSSVEVTFPDAAEPASVRLHGAMIHIIAPDGSLTARVRYRDSQSIEEPLVPPPGWWPRLVPADVAGSQALRGLTREVAEQLVDAALHGPAERAAALDRLLPTVTEPRLRSAIDDLVRRAAEVLPGAMRLRDRLGIDRPERAPSLIRRESGPSGARDDATVIAARIVARALADAADPGTPHLLRAMALPPGFDPVLFTFGKLGAEALTAAWPWTPARDRDRSLITLRTWGDIPWGDGSGRWRLHQLAFTGGNRDRDGELWRTPSGSLFLQPAQIGRHRGAWAVEHSPDGRFEPLDLPGHTELNPAVPQGWGGARITEFVRLLDERGPAPYDVAGVRDLAARTGLPLPEVASAAFGYPFMAGDEAELERYPAEILDLYTDPGTGERGHKAQRSYRLDRELREVLMPDDPADLWTTGPAYDRAAEWWRTTGSHHDDTPPPDQAGGPVFSVG